MASSVRDSQKQPWLAKAAPSNHNSVLQLEHPASPTSLPPTTPTKSTFKHLFTFTSRRHIPLLVLALIAAAVEAAGRTVYAILIGRIFDVISRFGSGLLPPGEFLSQISRWALWMCVLGVGVWLSSTVDVATWVIGGELRARTAREEVYGRLLGRRMGWFEQRPEGLSGLMTRVQRQTRELQTATSQMLGYLVCDVFVFGACIVVAFVSSFKLTLIMLATGVPSALILWGISRFLDPAIEGQKRELAQAAKHVTAATTAIDLVKVYAGADHEAFQFISAIRRSARYYTRQALCNCAQMSYVKLWMIMLFVLGFYVAVLLVGKGQLTPGNALTTFYAVRTAFQAIETLGPHWLVLAKGMAAGQLLRELVKEGENGEADEASGWRKPSKCLGDIRMSNVSFAYPANPSKTVLKPSCLRFEAGQLTFVVGRSGSGKSTLGNLLVRLYEPLTGQITMDGNPITTVDLDWLRRSVTLIQQSSILFNGTFRQNVAFGAANPDSVSSKSIQDACSMALLQSTIASMPDGVNTVIGPGGYSLSGGQKQRLALARARLRDPPVLILDELTSGLDPASRNLIMEAIRIWRKGKTTIIITHEVGHIEDDEYVYVMADGSIVQKGLKRDITADESGLFASLIASSDDASSRASMSSDSESDSSVHFDKPVQEAQYAKFLRSAFVDSRPMSIGLVRRISIRGNAAGAGLGLGRSVSQRGAFNRAVSHRLVHQTESRKTALDRSSSRRLSRTPSINIVTQRGLKVQESRTLNARRALEHLDADGQASLDSLELFFLERLAKRKDRDKPSRGKQLPSLTVILQTVWPNLDKSGKVQLVLGILLCLLIAACNPVFSFFFANLIGEFWVVKGQESSVSKWAGLLAVIAVVDASATFFGYFFMEKAAQQWINTLRAEAIKRILSQPKSWFDKASHSPSRITQCLDRNAEEMRKVVGMFVPILLTVTIMISASLVWALAIRWDLTLVTLAGLPVAFAATRANSYMSDKWEAICDEAAASTSAIFNETFANIKVVRALTMEHYFADKHTRSASAAYHLGMKRAGFIGLFYGLHLSISYFLTALVFFYGAKVLSEGLTSVTDVIRVMNLLLISLGTAVSMLGNVPQIAAAKATAVQMLYYANLSHTASHEAEGERRLLTPLPIRMTNLRFAYPGAPQTLVLRNINLQIDAGTCTAIVGASGCGKSTIASLLMRLYEPVTDPSTSTTFSPFSKQQISPIPESLTAPRSLNSHPVSLSHPSNHSTALTYASFPATSLHTPSLRTHIAYVPQTPFLFPTTVRANLTYGLHDASPLHAESNIILAAKQANIHDFIVSLSQGYDTPLGEGGLAVSGGQAQRLCIARALAHRPRVLVLDEPTSALDAQAAAEVRRVVQMLVVEAGRERQGHNGWRMAVVVVTHSKEMMKIADRVVMIEGGVVVEQGGYEELVARGGKFKALVGGGVWTGGGGEEMGEAAEWKGRDRRMKRKGGGLVAVDNFREDALRRLEGGV
ncbi:P-loop containing nucleoside triphosphate hydrolase protein [Parathielavia appendiculata]|uniref:P-loop containing nucleoside triphosphate hydrolase protein n=1 Tax=Parathielavia appendiculata TaxID=2587402 RepID=A0AAN6TWB0_9PEZI|nr:P-loop containing nucleoside triphosphate hydrolase protein [Parathielavia appendiculata]